MPVVPNFLWTTAWPALLTAAPLIGPWPCIPEPGPRRRASQSRQASAIDAVRHHSRCRDCIQHATPVHPGERDLDDGTNDHRLTMKLGNGGVRVLKFPSDDTLPQSPQTQSVDSTGRSDGCWSMGVPGEPRSRGGSAHYEVVSAIIGFPILLAGSGAAERQRKPGDGRESILI